MGRRRKKNDSGVSGVLLVDKPVGPTSFDIVAQVRRALGTARVGHTGTLDPFASGLLVVVVGRYTKIAQYLTAQNKSYEAIIRFGSETDSCDRTGEVTLEKDVSFLTREKIETALEQFRGDIVQVPPAFSAIKVDGERLYKKARRGEDVDVPPRNVTIHALTLDKFEEGKAHISVTVSKGTYIRALARDIGRALEAPAHLEELRRTEVGRFNVRDSIVATDAQASDLQSNIEALSELEPVVIDAKSAERLRHGQKVPSKLVEGWGDEVHAAFYEGELVALVKRHHNGLAISRGLWPEPARPKAE